jgi:membrane-bound lytic murein transglycosylase D
MNLHSGIWNKNLCNFIVSFCFMASVMNGTGLFGKTGGRNINHIDRQTAAYDVSLKALSDKECDPVLALSDGTYNNYLLPCNSFIPGPELSKGTGNSVLHITDKLAPRVIFWMNIFGHFDSNFHVLHSEKYPEVMLEAFHSVIMNSDVSALNSLKRKLLRQHKKEYVDLLLKMHAMQLKNQPFTAKSMQYIAGKMRHISDRHKFKKMAETLRFQRGQKNYIENGLQMHALYGQGVEKEFTSRGLPRELSYLAFIESSFNVHATSCVGAGGIYQLMPFAVRGRMLMTRSIDERRDPIKSAAAAAMILKENYQTTRSWPLAVTAYNHGLNGIKRARDKVKSSDLHHIIDRYDARSFGFASENFYAELLAISELIRNREKYYPSIKKEITPLSFVTITVPRNSTIASLAKRYRLQADQLYELNIDINPRLFKPYQPLPKGYKIKIPATAGTASS